MKLVVLDGHAVNPGDNPWDPVARLGELVVHQRTPPEQVLERARDADVLLVNKVPLDREVIGALPRLRLVSILATGFNIVDLEAARERGVPVCNVPEYGTDSVAQLTLALLLTLCHRVQDHDAAVHAGEWARRGEFSFTLGEQIELAGLTLGIVGFGRIGRRVGELAHALGMRVLACARERRQAPAYEPFAWRGLADLAAESDVITLHCPETPATRGLVNAAFLGRVKRGALLLNTARGALVVEADLAAALDAGRLRGAAVDVVSVEPITADNPLLRAKNLILTPHLAWTTRAARQRLMTETAANVGAWLAGETRNVVNGVGARSRRGPAEAG